MASRVARKLNDLCVFFHAHAKELLKNYGYEEKAWKDYLDECQRIRITFELALYLEPHDKEIIENLLLLCNDNIEGYTYKDSDSGRICKYRPSLHYSERLNGLCDRYQGIQKLQDKEHLSQHRQPLNVFEVYTERLNTAKCASRLLNEIESHSLGNGGIPLFAGVTLAFLAWYFEWEHIAIYLSVLGLIFLGAKMWDANSKELAQKKSAYTELVQEEDALFDL